jgi:hypothetical protein
MSRFTIPLFAICLAFAGWAVWERIQNAELNRRVAELEDAAKGPGIPEMKSTPGTATSTDKKIKAIAADTAAAGKETVKPGGEGKSMADGLVKMMEDPKMRDAFKAQARMGIDMVYRDLFDLLNLQEPKRSELEKLISEKAAAGMEIGFSMLGTKKTPEEIKAASAELVAKNKEMDNKIKALLGEEDFNKVQRYEDSTNERMQLKTFSGMLASKNLEIDEATESRLMDAMYDERKNFPFASEFSSQHNPNMGRFTADNMTRFGEEYGQMSESVVNRAAGILTAPQLEVFKESQTQMATMVQMHIEMAGKMFGPGEAASNP